MKRMGWLVLFCILAGSISGCGAENERVLTGIVEAPMYSHYSEVSGKIVALPVELGQSVKAGEIVAVLDDSDAKYAIEQLATTLAKKQALLAELQNGPEPESLRQGANNVTIALENYRNTQAAYRLAEENYTKNKVLAESGAVAQSALDELHYQLETAERAQTVAAAQLANAQEQLSLLRAGTVKEKLTYAEADLAQTESQMAQAQDDLHNYTITAVADGTVLSKNYLLGDIVAAGYNIADISADGEKYLVAYLPEAWLSALNYGQEVVIRSGDGELKGQVSYLDVNAQYTPKDFQTAANKNKNSVKIKVRLAADCPLKPGEKAELVLGE